MITKRSNHIPMFTKIEITNSARMLVRIVLNHRSWGRNALQMIIVQLAHQNGPKARYQKAARSFGLPTNHAVKYSTQYAYRSDEHTAELQSPCNLVCRLLLEK